MLLQHSCTSRSRAHDGSAKAKKQKTKKTDETLLTVSRNWSAAMSAGFPLTLRVFHVGHPWTPFPVFLPEHVALKHAILSVQVILRTGNGNSDCVCVCAAWGGWVRGGGGWGGETGYVGNNTKHKKCHMIWSEGLIYLASERICCMWFGGENVFLLCSQCAQTQHMETFSERPWVCEKKRAPDILFLLPLFIAFLELFFLPQTDWITYICLPHVERNSLMNICIAFDNHDVQLVIDLFFFLQYLSLLHVLILDKDNPKKYRCSF